MDKINPTNFVLSKLQIGSALKIQEGFLAFAEKPSDKYKLLKEEAVPEQSNSRINAFELFSLFTADIIKKNVLFIR
jgi:hypothetical protein